MEFDQITVCGGGILGSQISWYMAFKGINVVVYDIDDSSIARCKELHKRYAGKFGTSEPFSRLTYSISMDEAFKSSSLIIESITENPTIKAGFYRTLSDYIDNDVIVATNSSTMKPSELKGSLKRPERFLSMHFANPVWEADLIEIMGHNNTDKSVFDRVVHFTEEIGMIPIKIYKEQRGYVLNSMLVPWLVAAQNLYFSGVADYEDIDRVWMLSLKTDIGPFGVMDVIGLKTIYDITLMDAQKTKSEELFRRAEIIKREFLDKNKLGMSSGEGFYKYPNPKYKESNFLKKNKQ